MNCHLETGVVLVLTITISPSNIFLTMFCLHNFINIVMLLLAAVSINGLRKSLNMNKLMFKLLSQYSSL